MLIYQQLWCRRKYLLLLLLLSKMCQLKMFLPPKMLHQLKTLLPLKMLLPLRMLNPLKISPMKALLKLKKEMMKVIAVKMTK